MRTDKPNTAAAAGFAGLTVGFLIFLAAVVAFLVTICGCGSAPRVRQQPTARVSTTGDVQVEQPTISEIAHDLTAKIESVGGDMTQVGHKLDEQRRLLEETRLRKQQLQAASAGLSTMAVVLLLAAAPNIFMGMVNKLTLAAYLIAIGSLVGSYMIPLIFAL